MPPVSFYTPLKHQKTRNCILEIYGILDMAQGLSITRFWMYQESWHGRFSQGIVTSRVLNMPEFWIYSQNNFKIFLNLNILGKLWKIRYVRSVYDLKPELFFLLWTIFISCQFSERVWEIMGHPRYCLANHQRYSPT